MSSRRRFHQWFNRVRFQLVLCISIVVLAMTIIVITPASAWVHHPGWWAEQSNEVPVTYRWGSNLQGPSAWRTAFARARDDWNTRPTKVQWSHYESSLNIWNTYWADDGWYGYASWVLHSNDNFYWCDAFGNTYGGYSTTDNQRRSTAGHELGHCLGLAHSNVPDAIMRSGRNRDVIFSPWQDDVDGINAKYGTP